jgi:hypothetical protein
MMIIIKSRTQVKGRGQSGATVLELALVLALVFFLLMGIFEYAFYLTSQSLTQLAAQKAATMLSVAPDLDKACTDCAYPATTSCTDEQNACLLRRAEQVSNAKRAALAFLYSTVFFTNDPLQQSPTTSYVDPGIDFSLPMATFGDDPTVLENRASGIDLQLPTSPRDGVDVKSAYSQTPIRVVITAQRSSFLTPWGSSGVSALRSVAQTWKEISISQSNPPALDCQGNPITDPNNPANNRNCRCALNPSDPFLVATAPGAATCSCMGNMQLQAGSCVCPANSIGPPDSQGVCACTNTTCLANEKVATNCQCVPCPDGNFRDPLNPGNCLVCPAGSCNSDERVATDSLGFCSCIPCSNPNTTPGTGSQRNQCVCKSHAAIGCGSGEIVDGSCNCYDCASTGKVASGGKCICPGSPNCVAPMIADSSNCSCICKTGFKLLRICGTSGGVPTCQDKLCESTDALGACCEAHFTE